VLVLSVAGSIASEKLAPAWADSATSVAPLAGLMAVMTGGVLSVAGAVVKVETRSAASGLPAVSFTPAEPPLIVRVWAMLGVRSAVGSRVTVLLPAA
jgi:hypothetical protein